MIRRGLTRCLWTSTAAARRAPYPRFSSPPISGVRFASPSSAEFSGEDCVYGEPLPPPPPPPKAASIPTLLQPRVVIYDGVCHLCHRVKPDISTAGVKWLIKVDKYEKIKFCCLQSKAAEPYLRLCGVDREDVLRRFLFIEGPGAYYEGSTAALKVASYLPFPYSVLSSLLIIPAPLRDAVYDYVAKRRYDWFGKEEECIVMQDKELLERFIDRDEMLGGGDDRSFF